MSRRTEQAAVVAMYRQVVANLNAQAAVLHGDQLAPIIRFMEAQERLANQALQELDRIRWTEEQADAVRSAYYGDLMPAEG
jgi:hypothetical protein